MLARLLPDKTVASMVGARIWNSASGVVTLGLIVHRLSINQQGVYYVLLSLGATQLFAELGVSYAITNLVSHEMGAVTWSGTWEGAPKSLGRIDALRQFSLRWFTVTAALFAVIAGLGGTIYLRSHTSSGVDNAVGAWLVYVSGTCVYLLVEGRLAFLLGAGNGEFAGTIRVLHAVGSSLILWAGLLAGTNVLALGVSVLAPACFNLAFLTFRYHEPLRQLAKARSVNSFSWRSEIWPFQWRLSVSFVAGYFTSQVVPAFVDAFSGKAAAGRFGLSLQIVASLNAASYTWMSTVCARMGPLYGSGDHDAIRQTFRRAFVRSALLLGAGLAGAFALILLSSSFRARTLPLHLFAWLAGIGLVSHIVFSLTALLRSRRSDPVWAVVLLQAIVTTIAITSFRRPFHGALIALSAGTVCALIGTTTLTRRFFEQLNTERSELINLEDSER